MRHGGSSRSHKKNGAEKSMSAAQNSVDILHCRYCALPPDYMRRSRHLTVSACRHTGRTPRRHREPVKRQAHTAPASRSYRRPPVAPGAYATQSHLASSPPAGPPHRLADAPTCTLCRRCRPAAPSAPPPANGSLAPRGANLPAGPPCAGRRILMAIHRPAGQRLVRCVCSRR